MGAEGLCGAGDEAPVLFFLQKQAGCKHTGAEEGEVGVSGRVVPVGTDHRLGVSGLLAFPKVGICSPVEAGSILLGACTDALAPALGCCLHPSSSPGTLNLATVILQNQVYSLKPFSCPAQAGHTNFSLFLEQTEVLPLAGDTTCFLC